LDPIKINKIDHNMGQNGRCKPNSLPHQSMRQKAH